MIINFNRNLNVFVYKIIGQKTIFLNFNSINFDF